MAMKLGIYLNSQHPESDDPARRFAETLEQVRLIRSLGFDSIWAGEHHVTPGFHFFPQLALAAAPRGRRRGAVARHQRHAAAAAQPGRAGRGRRLHGCDHRRQVPARRRARLSAGGVRRSTACRCRSASAGSPRPSRSSAGCGPRIASRTTAATGSSAMPPSGRARCSRRGRPSSSARRCDAAIARAAKIGDGWLVVPIPTLDQLAKQMSIYSAARSAAKLPPSPHICRLLEVGCAPDDETAFRRVAPHPDGEVQGLFLLGAGGPDAGPRMPPRSSSSAASRSNRFAVGSPAQGDRHAARPASRRHHPPLDARELAGHAPGRHPRRHRAARAQGAARSPPQNFPLQDGLAIARSMRGDTPKRRSNALRECRRRRRWYREPRTRGGRR